MKIIISLYIWIAGSLLTVMLALSEFMAVVMFPFDKKRKMAHAQSFWWSDALIGLNPYWNLTVRGLENIDRRKTYIIVANHQSLADIMVLYKTRIQFKWVAKESLFRLPFLGWAMILSKYIRLKRGKFGSIKKVYREAAYWLRNNISVAFFPEGTRSDTEGMREFQNGAFKLAIKERKPILPVSISGTREAIPKGSWIFKSKVSGVLNVLEPVDTAHFEPKDFAKLRDIVRLKLENAVNDK